MEEEGIYIPNSKFVFARFQWKKLKYEKVAEQTIFSKSLFLLIKMFIPALKWPKKVFELI